MTRRRRFLQATGAGVAATGLAGCLGGDGGGGGDGSGGGGGGGGSGPEVPVSDRDEIRVGVLAPVPSENPIGASIANGARLAAQQINENGGVEGADLNVIVKDTQEAPQTGRNRTGNSSGRRTST